MAFTRVKPTGWAMFEKLTSAQANQLDIDHANAVDGAAGGTYPGPVVLTGATLGGSSQVNTTGQVTTTGTVQGSVVNATNDVTATDDIIAGSALKGVVAMAEKYQPRSVNTQAVDTGVVSSVTLDFTEFDTF